MVDLATYPVMVEYVLKPDIICSFYLNLCIMPRFEVLDVDLYINRLIVHKPVAIANNDFIDGVYE